MEIKKRTDENDLQYIWRIANAKENGELDMNWHELADLFNSQLCVDEEEYKTEAGWRKPFQAAKMFYDQNVFRKGGVDNADEIKAAKQALYTERVKLRDERNELSRLLREQARRESYIESIQHVFIEDIQPFDCVVKEYTDGNASMIIHLTDIHAGLGINNYINSFDNNELYRRLNEYLSQINEIRYTHQCKDCVLALGGDMISGIIHTSIRLENNENVIAQTKRVCRYIAEFVDVLRRMFNTVQIYSVSGNHGRLTPNTDAHLNGEELDSLIPFYLSAVFANDHSVKIHENPCGEYISTFELCGHKWVIVHGDKDDPKTVANDMTKLLGYTPDGILMGHRHTNGLSSDGRTKIIQSGSVCGTDRYAFDRRLFGAPEQMVVITDNQHVVKCLYDIQL